MDTYSAYGLTFCSEVALPDLPRAGGEAQVTVRCGAVAGGEPTAASRERHFCRTADGVLLEWRDFGRFLVRQGTEILVEPATGAHESVIRHLLMGPVFAVLNYQRGRAIFHASAVALPAGGAAILGAKGFGKSTQAAALVRRGGALITDDLLTLDMLPGQVMAAPGVPFLKLWPEALHFFGDDPGALALVKENLEKRTLPIDAGFVDHPVPLRALYLLGRGPEVALQKLSPREALQRIIPHWYGSLFGGELLPVLGIERQFWECTALVERVPVYLLKRPPALERLPELCQVIECSLSANASVMS